MRAVISFLILLFTSFAFADEATIRVRAETELEMQKAILLGDIADFSGFTDDEIADLKAESLGDVPQPGSASYFSSVAITQALRPHLKKLQERKAGEKIALQIPERVTVKRKVLKLQASEIESELLKQFGALCADCELSIQNLAVPTTEINLPSGSVWAVKTRKELPKGSFSVPVEIKHEDSTRRLFWVNGQMEIYRRVPVAKRALTVGQKLQEDDFVIERRAVTFSNDASPDAVELKSAYLNHSVSAGQVIWRNSLRRENALRAGESAKIVTGADDWQISIEGVAQQSGYVGDLVKVRIPRTQKTVSGTIVEKGIVEVK